MKFSQRFILIILLIGSIHTQAKAQGKIGYVNTAEIIAEMPEKMEVEKQINIIIDEVQEQLTMMTNELESKITACNWGSKPELTDEERKRLESQLKEQHERIQKFEAQATENIKNREAALLEPIIEKIRSAISNVAKQEKYDHVFDLNSDLVLVFPESNDFTDLVKKELGF